MVRHSYRPAALPPCVVGPRLVEVRVARGLLDVARPVAGGIQPKILFPIGHTGDPGLACVQVTPVKVGKLIDGVIDVELIELLAGRRGYGRLAPEAIAGPVVAVLSVPLTASPREVDEQPAPPA